MEDFPIEVNSGSGADTPAAEKLQRTDWMTIIGVISLVLLISGAIWALSIGRQFRNNAIVQSLIAMAPQIEELQNMTHSQVEQQAASLSADELLADPRGYEGRFVVIDGHVSEDASVGVLENIALNSFGPTDFGGLVLNDGLVLIDISGKICFLKEGTAVRGFGKVLVARSEDFFDIPLVGADLKREFGDAPGMAEEVVFLISNGIEIEEVPRAQLIGSR